MATGMDHDLYAPEITSDGPVINDIGQMQFKFWLFSFFL